MMNQNTILVVMPVYNSEATLKWAIDSILRQTYTNLHLVIVDDASTDRSLEIAKEYSSNDRVTIIRNQVNSGAYFSRNIGLYKFRSQPWGFFTTHDADDVSNPDRFEIMCKNLQNNRTNAIQDSWERKHLSNKKSIGVSLTCAHAMFKREVFKQLGYFEMMRFGADWEHWARLTMFNKRNNRLSRSIKTKMGSSYVAPSNLTEQIPIGAGPREEYVESKRQEHRDMNLSNRFYRDFNPRMKAKPMPTKVDKNVAKMPIKASDQSSGGYSNVRITVVLLTWKRLGKLKQTLTKLSNQTFKNFEVHISNADTSRGINIQREAQLFKEQLKIRVTNDGNDLFAFRRMTVGKKLAEEGTDIILFIDDDISFDHTYVENCLRYYEPKSYKSGFAWSFQDNGSDYYTKRTRINDSQSKIHYCGTGIGMIDASIFLDDGLISKAPPEALKIEDLWLSYYAQHVKKWKLGHIPMSNVEIGGADSVALYKSILAGKKSDENNADKADFLRLLVKEYKWKL